jgi:hypothetical protein
MSEMGMLRQLQRRHRISLRLVGQSIHDSHGDYIQIVLLNFAWHRANEFHIRASVACSNKRMDLYFCDWTASLWKARVVAPDDGSACFLLPCRMGAAY